jgi:hypothetical protein
MNLFSSFERRGSTVFFGNHEVSVGVSHRLTGVALWATTSIAKHGPMQPCVSEMDNSNTA